jgi:hypothetical protein
MAKFDKIKIKPKKGPLGGALPPTGESTSFITLPETYGEADASTSNIPNQSNYQPRAPEPTSPNNVITTTKESTQQTAMAQARVAVTNSENKRARGGRGRKTGRTLTFATRSTEEFLDRFNRHCETTQLNKNVFLERLLSTWEERYGQPGSYSLAPSPLKKGGYS